MSNSIERDAHTGQKALDLALEIVPLALKEEARWWVQTSAKMGTDIIYLGKIDGMCIWSLPDGSRSRLKSKPPPLSREENEKIERECRWYQAGQYEMMIDQYKKLRGQAF